MNQSYLGIFFYAIVAGNDVQCSATCNNRLLLLKKGLLWLFYWRDVYILQQINLISGLANQGIGFIKSTGKTGKNG